MAAPKWLRDYDGAPPDADEGGSCDAPPRYSVTNLVSLAPAPLTHTSSRWNTWSARLLFATISCAVVALLVLELTSLRGRVPLTPARALTVLLSLSP